jgi:hypothetical protein
MQSDQTLASMVDEVLTRQAKAGVRQTGEWFEVALRHVLYIDADRQLWKLSRGPRRHEKAA